MNTLHKNKRSLVNQLVVQSAVSRYIDRKFKKVEAYRDNLSLERIFKAKSI